MKMRILRGAVAAVAMAFSWTTAQAQLSFLPAGGAPYFGIEGGWTGLNDATDHLRGGSGFKETFDTGYNVGARAGYEWGPWRLEEEFNFGTNKLTGLRGLNGLNLGAGFPVTGQRNRYALMTNLIYDFNVGWVVT